MFKLELENYQLIQQYEKDADYDGAIELCKQSRKNYPSRHDFYHSEIERLEGLKNNLSSPKRKQNQITLAMTSPQKNTPKKLNSESRFFKQASPDNNNHPSRNRKSQSFLQDVINKSAKPKTKKDKELKAKELVEIGKLGEKLAYDYLKVRYINDGYEVIENNEKTLGCKLKHRLSSYEVEIIWLNKNGESGYPYDIVVKQLEEGEIKCIKYFEVKSTKKNKPCISIFSGNELRMMRDVANYFVLKVSNIYAEYKVEQYSNFYFSLFADRTKLSQESNHESYNNIGILADHITELKIEVDSLQQFKVG